jgi:hypothetical protein
MRIRVPFQQNHRVADANACHFAVETNEIPVIDLTDASTLAPVDPDRLRQQRRMPAGAGDT